MKDNLKLLRQLFFCLIVNVLRSNLKWCNLILMKTLMKELIGKVSKIILVSLICITATFSNADVVQADGYTIQADLRSDYVYAVDITHDVVLLDERSKERMYPASLTKMMTVIVCMELYEDYSQEIEITEEMLAGLKEADASIAGYSVGDKATVADLFYGCMLPSGADACNALAITLSGSIDNFVKLMNNKAVEIGMKDTHFENPTGLHDDNHYSTCRDMATLVEYCIQNDEFVKVASTLYHTTDPTKKDPEGIELVSLAINGFLRRDLPCPGLVGGKTGYTDEALQCIGLWAEYDDMTVNVITCHGLGVDGIPAHFGDASKILEVADRCDYQKVTEEGQVAGTVTFKHMFSEETYDITCNELYYDIPYDEDVKVYTTFEDVYETDTKERVQSGKLIVSVEDQIIYEKNLKITIPKEKNLIARFIKSFKNLFK